MLVRTMCVWSSKTNTSCGTPFSAYAAVSYISTGLTLKSFLPYTSFIARNDAASPPVPMRNLRRVVPSRLAASSASSLTLYSTCFWSSVCGCGMYSPLETIRVGTGATNGSVSAGATRLCCASLSHESSSRLSGGRREFDHIEVLPHWWVLNPPVRVRYLAARSLATLTGMARAGREQRPGSVGRAVILGVRVLNSRSPGQMGSLMTAVFPSADQQPLPQPRPRWPGAHPGAPHPGVLHRIVTPAQTTVKKLFGLSKLCAKRTRPDAGGRCGGGQSESAGLDDAAQELLGALDLGFGEQLGWRGVLDDGAVGEEADPVRD